MTGVDRLRVHVKAARKRGSAWVGVMDVLRLLPRAEGRSQLWTKIWHGGRLHQSTPYTEDDRYPDLFDLAATLRPDASRILSFGCSTGEEISALRKRFPLAEIVGAEINSRSRRIAARRLSTDNLAKIVGRDEITGSFDIIFALAVLQREPHKVEEMELEDLSRLYAFQKFDSAIAFLVRHLVAGGLLCVMNAHYRVEDSASAADLEPLPSPTMREPLFAPNGRRLSRPVALSVFRKL